MKHEIATQWIEALRSGDYEKGAGQLLDDKGDRQEYCCLGVLTDLYCKNVQNVDKFHMFYLTNLSEPLIYLAPEVIEWAGVKNNYGGFRWQIRPTEIREQSLASINDRDGTTFSEIADLIEQHVNDL